jgi:hypothetical protein
MRLASRQKYLTETNHEALNLSLKSQTNPANLSLESPAAHTETKKPHAESIKNAEFKESLLVDIRGMPSKTSTSKVSVVSANHVDQQSVTKPKK